MMQLGSTVKVKKNIQQLEILTLAIMQILIQGTTQNSHALVILIAMK